MRRILILLFGLLLAPAGAWAEGAVGDARKEATMQTLWELKARALSGEERALSAYAGKVALVVNVASACGYTPQYEGLQALHERYAARGFVVLGFPSNEFGGQEPGTAEEIASFCRTKYGVTFPMFQKVEVKPGPSQSPVYAFLTRGGDVPAWNFSKYLVGRDGKVVSFHPSKVTPEALAAQIEPLLSAP